MSLRISTGTIYDLGVSGMQSRTRDMVKTQQQLSTGRRILTPSDDPAAATRVLEVTQSREVNKQFADNTVAVTSSLGLYESVLSDATRVIQDVKTLAVNAGNSALTAGDLRSLAAEMDSRYRELLGISNSTDGNGQYLFSGYMTATLPFAETSPGNVVYFGDEGSREVQVAASRTIAVSDSGASVFMRIRNGNGAFATAAAAANSGSGVIGPGSVTNSALLTGHSYSVTFSVTPAGTTYSVIDNTAATTVVNNAAYTSNASISFDGLQVEVSGNPAAGDTFTVAPSTQVSLFKTVSDLRDALLAAADGEVGTARLANALNTAHVNLQNSLDRVLSVTASVGARLKENEALAGTAEDMGLQFQTTLSQLQDLDYAKAISDLTMQQTYLEAAQKSFARVTSLGLFSLL